MYGHFFFSNNLKNVKLAMIKFTTSKFINFYFKCQQSGKFPK